MFADIIPTLLSFDPFRHEKKNFVQSASLNKLPYSLYLILIDLFVLAVRFTPVQRRLNRTWLK